MTEPSDPPLLTTEGKAVEPTDLGVWAIETREMYVELVDRGFSEGVAAQIIGHILYDVMTSRFELDDEDDDYEDYDSDGPFSG